jgi:hypothetical protein
VNGPCYHFIKCEQKVYRAVFSGLKKFEYRLNDRGYQLGDYVVLLETCNNVVTRNELQIGPITFILYGPQFGIPEGYCVFNW